MTKKAQSMGINVVIIAAIAVLVLVIIAVLITRSANDTNKAANCITKGGICKEQCNEGEREITDAACPIQTDHCCRIA